MIASATQQAPHAFSAGPPSGAASMVMVNMQGNAGAATDTAATALLGEHGLISGLVHPILPAPITSTPIATIANALGPALVPSVATPTGADRPAYGAIRRAGLCIDARQLMPLAIDSRVVRVPAGPESAAIVGLAQSPAVRIPFLPHPSMRHFGLSTNRLSYPGMTEPPPHPRG